MAKPIIMTVDDEVPVLNAVERDLRRQYGEKYRILKASSGGEALDAVKELKKRNLPVALFLVDQRMPTVSGTGGDWRDIKRAAADGDERAQLAAELFVTGVRDYLGAYLLELGGADAVVFTGGIGEHNPPVRSAVLAGAEFAGIRLDAAKNDAADGEARIDADDSAVAVWMIPANEELIVARQARELLEGGPRV